MEERQAFMRDLFNSYLRGLTEADVRGMAGLLFVKSEIAQTGAGRRRAVICRRKFSSKI